MVTLDASVWLAAAFPGEPAHEVALALLGHVTRAGIPVSQPTLFVVEVAGAVRRRTGSAAAAEAAIEQVAGLDLVTLRALDGDDAMGAAALAGRLGLRGANAVYLAHAITVGTALVTLDDELLVRGAAVADVWTPAAWLARHSP
jgi:predicted nucleic acid-binding protein